MKEASGKCMFLELHRFVSQGNWLKLVNLSFDLY